MALSDTLDRLKAAAFRSQHDFKPNLDLFADPNEDQLAERHRIVERAKERGARNEPPSSFADLDPVEREITDAIRSLRDESRGKLDLEFEAYADRFAQLDFNGRATTVEIETGKAITDFRSRIAEEADLLEIRKNSLIDAERELEAFRRAHRLERVPRVLGIGGWMFRVGVVAVLFLIEVLANSSLLAKGNELGFLGAFTEALALAALNIGTAWLASAYPWRWLNRRELWWKFLGFALAISHLVFAGALNLAIAHYRDISGTLIGDAGKKVIERVQIDTFGLADIQSWSLFGIGLIFAIIALIDVYGMGDPYPGYEECGRRRQREQNRFQDTRAEVFQLLKERLEKTVEAIEEALSQLNRDFLECGRIEASSKRVIGRFRAHENALESCANILLQRYREANAGARQSKQPAHFSKRWELIRSEISDESASLKAAQGVTALHEKSLSAGKQAIEQINRAYEEAISRLAAIGDVVKGRPDTIDVSGSLASPTTSDRSVASAVGGER